MRVVVAEKPSVARELARVLGCTHKENGFFRGPGHVVTYAVGHLVQLAEPDAMNPEWGRLWRREALPMIPSRTGAHAWKYAVEPKTAPQFKIVAGLMNDPATSTIINATDAGREGEAIFRRIYALAKATKPVLRFWTSSLTEEAIEQAFERLRPAAELDGLGAAAEARARLDWLVGMNHTRASTILNGQLCSIGRVQTPTLAIIVRRHHEIARWVRTYFFEVHAELAAPEGDFIARALNPAGKFDFDQRPQAELILADVPAGTAAQVTAVEKKPQRTPPPQLHNLGELQKDANRRFGLTADRTLACAQTLYEAKAITYPRSSSRYLSEDMQSGLPAILRPLKPFSTKKSVPPSSQPHRDEWDPFTAALTRATKGPKLSKRFIDGSKLSDHHAIIPTAKGLPASAGPDERKVYQILAERFITMFLPDKETEETRITLSIAGHPFRAVGIRLVAPGWTALTGASSAELEDQQALPAVKPGQQLEVLDSALVQKERKPPAKYTDATLLSAMETAGRQIDDDTMREAMRGRGLGTEATRAAILKRLLDLGYITRAGKLLEAEPKGLALIAQLEASLPHLASPELTGDMEAKLELVEQGALTADDLLAEIATALRRDIPRSFTAKPIPAAPKSTYKPAFKSSAKPTYKPAFKSAAKPTYKSAAKSAARPAFKSAAKPAFKSAAKSTSKPAAKRAFTKPKRQRRAPS